MAKAYVLTEGEYSDYHIIGVYSTRENAEAIKKWLLAGESENSYFASLVDIEEYELDPCLDAIRQGLTAYQVHMKWDGDTEGVYSADDCYSREEVLGVELMAYPWGIRGKVFARDEQHAVKIVNEKRAQMIAQGLKPQRN